MAREVRVSDLIERGVLRVEDGNHGENRPRREEFSTDGVSFIRAADMAEGRILFDRAERINNIALARIRKGIGAPGDILLSHKGTVGRVAVAPYECEPFVCSPQTTFWRVRDESVLDRRYLSYVLRADYFKRQLNSRKSETDMADYVSLTAQRSLTLLLPTINDQRAIGRTLGVLDDKIDLNRRMTETLERIARATFRSWFVDFDQVRAKMEGRPLSGLVAEFGGLVPDNLTDSELGPVPRGWRISSIGEEYQYVMGQSPPGSSYNETGEGVPLFQGKGEFGFRYPTVRLFCTEPKRMASAGDTLVSVRAPVGAMNLARVKCCIGRGLAAVRHKSGSASFTYYSLRELTSAFTAYDSEGTVFGSINKKDFGEIRCLQFPEALVLRADEFLSPIDALIEEKEEEQRTLAELRDFLLPRLVSGETRVEDAEKLAESVV